MKKYNAIDHEVRKTVDDKIKGKIDNFMRGQVSRKLFFQMRGRLWIRLFWSQIEIPVIDQILKINKRRKT